MKSESARSTRPESLDRIVGHVTSADERVVGVELDDGLRAFEADIRRAVPTWARSAG